MRTRSGVETKRVKKYVGEGEGFHQKEWVASMRSVMMMNLVHGFIIDTNLSTRIIECFDK